MKKVLVAGATGYLGKFVVKEFKRQGYWVRALARNPQKLEQQGPFLEPSVKEFIDDLFVGEITKPETLQGVADDIDVVFSSIGITRQKGRLTFRDVDYQGNKNLLQIAEQSNVKKFIFVSVFHAEHLQKIAVVRAREDFVRELKESSIQHVIIRPTGYFSDMSEFFTMAHSGRVYLIGSGNNRMNPIHGADLAKVCVDVVNSSQEEIEAGGPEVYSYREIAELAFSILNKPSKISSLPTWLFPPLQALIRPFSRKHAELLQFFSTAMQNDAIAPKFGEHYLRDYYEEFWKARWKGKK